MRFVFLTFGFLGFALVALAGFSAHRAPDLVLRDAAIGCVVAALLGRWFWRVLQNAAIQTANARRAAAEAAAEAEAAQNRKDVRTAAVAAANAAAATPRPSGPPAAPTAAVAGAR